MPCKRISACSPRVACAFPLLHQGVVEGQGDDRLTEVAVRYRRGIHLCDMC